MRRTGLIALTALLAGPAHAGLFGPVTLDANYQHQVEKDSELEGQGYSAGASIGIGQHFFAGAGYSSVRTDAFAIAGDGVGRYEYRSISGSLGGSMPLGDRAALSASGGYSVSRTFGLDGLVAEPVEQSEGLTGSVSLHLGWTRWLDMSLGRGWSFIGGERSADSSMGLSFPVLRNVWIDSSYWIAEGARGWTAGLSMRLGD